MTTLHPFEAAKLGKAPFQCVGCRENRFEMPGFGWKPGGCCNYCGTGILYEFVIRGADGSEFVVGSDCVAKTHAEVAGFREERLKLARGKREARRVADRAKRQAEFEASRAMRALERAETMEREFPGLVARLQAFQGANRFVVDMRDSLKHWGGLTGGQAHAVIRTLDAIDAEAAKPESRHIGHVGERMRGIMAKVVFSKCIAEKTWDRPARYLVKLETAQGNVLTWFTNRGYKVMAECEECSFTVKGHDEYNGKRQTLVLRVTFP